MDSWMYAPSNNNGSATADTGTTSPRNSIEAGNASTNYSAIQAATCRESSAATESHKAGAGPRIRRRNRQITSCLECRRRKLKCDKSAPCTNCTRFRRDCLYLAPANDAQAQQKLAEIKEKMGALEKNLELEVASRNQKAHPGGGNVKRLAEEEIRAREEAADEEDEPNEEEDRLEPTPLATQDNVYEDNNDDELMDLGVQMGKMRISERIGGWIRPKLVEEINDTLEDVKAGKSRWPENSLQNDHHSLRPGAGPKLQAAPKSYIGPGPDYIAPASSFFFPGTNMSTSLIDYLPSKNASDQLVQQYWLAVHYMCRTVHRPTFEAQYAVFWGQIATGSEPSPSIQAIMFAAMFSAAVSMSNDAVMQRFGTTKNSLVDSLRSGTEMALAKANFLRTTKVDTMQAFIMYLIPLVRAEVSRAHSALVGTAIRLAECMGLHRDGSYYNMTPVEVQVRRMIWHQLCFLDMRTCEATGPRPQIRAEDYDTKMPWNVDDMDLLGDNAVSEDRDYWTDMTFMRIRAECQEMRRKVWYDVIQIDKKKKSLTSVLVKIQKFITSMNEKYKPMIDSAVPIQKLGDLMLATLTKALHLQCLHRYLFSTTQRMPDRLRQVLIEAGLTQMETSIALETTPSMSHWVWYRGAFNQYHAALLLLVEVYAYPMRKEAARIWKCLDYIFEIPSHLAPKQKAELVLTDLRDRMETYHQMRKMKVSNQMEQRLGLGSKSLYVRPDMIDAMALGHLQQQDKAAQGITITNHLSSTIPPAQFSPPPPVNSDSNSHASGSRQSSVANPGNTQDVQMGNDMADIDWAEWETAFDVSHYTGDLNIPDFNMADFTGTTAWSYPTQPAYAQQPYTSTTSSLADQWAGTAAANIYDISHMNFTANLPNAADLADVNFGPSTLIPAAPVGGYGVYAQQQQHQHQRGNSGGGGGGYGGTG
ncbi:hypothetical protein AC579_632 [Pseudocercospora musae]|uniref:Zn(2)-C6 fungal-type domain-containing protein n=1 Tax=Pseudocercospora musae TaxID=113226 RepID=A0A139HPY8_9PEZI|nr:hypothetical protein AC579_632 [Pseudocercospora musae]